MTLKREYEHVAFVCPMETGYVRINDVDVFGIRRWKNRYNRFATLQDLYRRGLSLKADVYHCHEPDSLLIGWLLQRKLGSMLVYDSHEFHPESFSESLPLILRKPAELVVRGLEDFLASHSDCVITVNDFLVDRFKRCANVLKLPNYPKLELVQEVDFQDRDRELVYVGGLSPENGIAQIVEALYILVKDGTNTAITFVGYFTDRDFRRDIHNFVRENNLEEYVKFTGYVNHQEALRIIARKCIGLSVIQPANIRQTTCQPIKLFEYMAGGNCVIVSDFPAVREVVGKYGCGILVNPQDPLEIAQAVKRLLSSQAEMNKLMRNSRRAVEQEYNWETVEKKLINLYGYLEGNKEGVDA